LCSFIASTKVLLAKLETNTKVQNIINITANLLLHYLMMLLQLQCYMNLLSKMMWKCSINSYSLQTLWRLCCPHAGTSSSKTLVPTCQTHYMAGDHNLNIHH
jgi:Na+/H+-dicarboxylate symporter